MNNVNKLFVDFWIFVIDSLVTKSIRVSWEAQEKGASLLFFLLEQDKK